MADARDIELKDLIAETVAGYLRFVGGLAVVMQHQIFILNVPAPLHSSKSSAAENASVANIVHLFNQSLTNLKAPSVCAVGTSGMARG